jgi:hypothetical protein
MERIVAEIVFRRTKGESDKIHLVAHRCCRVSITDMEGITHTVQVSASTLYEAVALGLRAVRKNAWAGEIPEGLNTVRVQVLEDPTEHAVQINKLQKWLDNPAGSPAEDCEGEDSSTTGISRLSSFGIRLPRPQRPLASTGHE